MTILENKTKTDTKNIILECSSKITFNEVSENIKKMLKTLSESYFKREYMFLSVDLFYKYNGKLTKENHTEQYFIIFFKNNKEFSELINNPHINISELNKKDIHFIFIISNTLKEIENEENYYLYNHLYLSVKKIKKVKSEYKNMSLEEIISTSGFHDLSDFSQLEIMENLKLEKESISRLRFNSIISEYVSDYYLDNFYKRSFSFAKLKNKLVTLF